MQYNILLFHLDRNEKVKLYGLVLKSVYLNNIKNLFNFTNWQIAKLIGLIALMFTSTILLQCFKFIPEEEISSIMNVLVSYCYKPTLICKLSSQLIGAFFKDLTVNAQDKDGNSPLHLVQMKHSQVQKKVELLL